MAFDGEAFVRRFSDVWNDHDLDGIIDMFTDDVVFEASFGEARGAPARWAKRPRASSSRT
jgi:ketosteroid isomerase-like protein